jgi:FlaA1/EpsC-like NDP-sugar epimerase
VNQERSLPPADPISPVPELPSLVYRVARGADNLSLRFMDLGIVAAAWALAISAAFDTSAKDMTLALAWIMPLAVIVQLVGHRLAGLYGPVWRYASVDEAARVVAGVLGGSILATITTVIAATTTHTPFPFVTAPPLAAFLSLLGCGGVRFQSRLFALERQQARDASGLRSVIVGAGTAGAALAYELTHTDAGRPTNVVGFIDDDPELVGRSVRGFTVLGTTDDLESICVSHRIERVLIAEDEDNRHRVKTVVDQALRTHAQVKVLPLSTGRVDGPLVRNLRDLDVTDLLGREHAPVDSDDIDHYLRDATVLITGAGGSIGSEIARQVARHRPARLLLLDRDESLLHDVTTGPLADSGVDIAPVLADICDQVRVQDLFENERPDVVFHAAAQKHVPILEKYPVEAVRTNVFGTWNLISTAAEYGTGRFVHISTDKAADPCSVMGATKRAAEQMVFEVGRRHQLPFVAVRFGNVLGSRGSVVPTFLRQIVDGGPVTVTSPEMTRYFMTIPEAVSLVLQSGAMADPGRVYLLDMGEPVSILALARQLIRLAGLRPGEDVRISIVGTRPGERLHERLHDDAESIEPSDHPSISSLNPKIPWQWDELVEALASLRKSVDARDDAMVRHQLESMLRKGGVDCVLDHGETTIPVDQHPGSPRATAIVRDLSEKRAERQAPPASDTGTVR